VVITFLLLALASPDKVPPNAWKTEPLRSLYSAPSSAGDPIPMIVRVRHRADGIQQVHCELVSGSGDQNADAFPCRMLPVARTMQVQERNVQVFVPAPYEGTFRGPIALTNPATWNDYRDIGPEVYKSGPEGLSVLRVEADEQGKVTRCRVVVKSISPIFDAILERNVCRRIKLQPATLDGVAVASTLLLNFRFVVPPD
jgi:Gram-negative bacterial TonB protein C-terminal